MTISIQGIKPARANLIQFKGHNPETRPVISDNQEAPKATPSANLLKVYFTGKAGGCDTILACASPQERKTISAFGQEYMDFLQKAKTNLSAAREVVKMAKAAGYKEYNPEASLNPGDKVYFLNRDRAVVLATIGEEPVTGGLKIVASHLDSPHITLKADPVQESEGYAIFKTMMHGLGSKRYQWVNRHLALEGTIITKDGKKVDINIGNQPGQKTFVIPDLAPHVDPGSNASKEFKAEEMNPIVALNGETEKKISEYVKKVLEKEYGIQPDDLLNAELNLVPAENPREIGFDEGLIGAYGHDDKSSVFASLKAEIDQNTTPKYTTLATFFGNEEIGSWNNYGAKSDFLKDVVGTLIENQKGSYNENDLRRTFKRSLALSADVSTGVDPIKPSQEEASNAARLGQGVIMKLQGWKNSLPEVTATITNIFKRNNVKHQPFVYNQDIGGGNTIGLYMSGQHNMDVVDIGIPILSMHAPVEIADKGDLYHLYKGIEAFLKNDKIKEIPFSYE
jgi:aspartyl aminopeptidase